VVGQTRERIVATAAELLARDGREAVTTRAVAAAAGVQAPTIYRLFGDKMGLLDAVAEHGFQAYLTGKGVATTDPVADLRAGWDLHVGFGLANPALYALMYGDPRPGAASPAAARAMTMLHALVGRIAAVGRLRVAEEQAVHLVHAAACGCVLTLLATAECERDPALSGLAREAALAAVIADAPAVAAPGPVGAAVALRAALADTDVVTNGERGLLREWLDRIAAGGAR
jgi:AcrR family transcriptional regulator